MATTTTKASKSTRRRLTFRPLPISRLPKVIPPRSVVILTSADRKETPDWLDDRGRFFRVGYYNREDGLDCVWLVNDAGAYEQTTDRGTLLRHFAVLHLSNEADLFGEHRTPLRPVKGRAIPASAMPSLLTRA